MFKWYVFFDVFEIFGVGVVGGMGVVVILVLKGDLCRGIEIVLDYINFDKYIEDVYFIIIGEGRIDK